MSKKLRMAAIGAGRWGPNLIRNFASHSMSEMVAVVELQAARRKAILDKYPNMIVTEDYSEVLKNPNVDAVVICTPTEFHFQHAKAALEHDKHVFVEKPLATTSAECRELVAIAKQRKRTLFVGHVFVYNAGVQAAARFIQSGEMGKVLYIHATRTNLGPIRTDVNALWDLAPHDISIFQYWLKEIPSGVSATGACFINPKVEDVAFATYSFPSGVVANIHVSWLNPKKVREIIVVGEKKMLLWDDMDLNSPIRVFDKKVSVDMSSDKMVDTFVGFRASIHEGDTTIPRVTLNEPLAAECDAFLKAVANPETSLSDGDLGTAVVAILEGTTLSMREKGKHIAIH